MARHIVCLAYASDGFQASRLRRLGSWPTPCALTFWVGAIVC